MKKYVEVDREPKVGDMVKVVKCSEVPTTNRVDDYKVGDILKIVDTKVGCLGNPLYHYKSDFSKVLNRSEFVVVEQVTCEFTKSDIKGGYLVKTQFGDIGIVIPTSENEWVLSWEKGGFIFESKDTTDDLLDIDGEDDYDIIEVYGYTTDQSDLFNPLIRELLFKREEVEDLGKKEYVIESTVNDNEITIAYNHPNGYDDSDDSIHILIGDDLSDDYAFTTISIQSAKDMIIALQEIVDYVEGGK